MRTLIYLFPQLLISGMLRTIVIGAIAYLLLIIINKIFRFSATLKYQLSNIALLSIGISFIQPFFTTLIQMVMQKGNKVAVANTFHTHEQIAPDKIVLANPTAIYASGSLLNSFVRLLEQYSNLIVFAYVIGLLFFSLRLIVSYTYSRQLKKKGILPANEHWTNMLANAKQMLDIKQNIRIAFTTHSVSPCIIGYGKALVLIPLSLVNNITTEQAEAILLHELAHLKQHDYYINFMMQFVQCLLFFNPFSWLIAKQCDLYREMSCDDVTKMHALNVALAESIGIIAGMQFSESNIALNLGTKRSPLLKRVDSLLLSQRPRQYRGVTAISASALVLTALFILCCTTKSISQPKDLKTQLEEISTQMFNEGNEKFIVVDAVKDSLLTIGKPYSILYMADDNLFISGHGLAWKGYKKEMDQAMSKQLKGEYIEKLQHFREKMGEAPNGVLDIGPRKNKGVTMQEILDPNSDFRKVNMTDRYRAGIRTVPTRQLIHHLIDDGLANANDSSVVYSFDREDIVFNHKKLSGEMKTKYTRYIKDEMGIDLQYDGASGVWGRMCRLSDF
ncbi:MAG: M56 family metallopeptidase [Bacteroidetes bacterium]|nr:M56 family metallopeptidase [Bacteroidota bacterium]